MCGWSCRRSSRKIRKGAGAHFLSSTRCGAIRPRPRSRSYSARAAAGINERSPPSRRRPPSPSSARSGRRSRFRKTYRRRWCCSRAASASRRSSASSAARRTHSSRTTSRCSSMTTSRRARRTRATCRAWRQTPYTSAPGTSASKPKTLHTFPTSGKASSSYPVRKRSPTRCEKSPTNCI